jgi:cell division protein FtsL
MTEQQISITEAKLMSHEAVCAERYKSISDSLDKGSSRMTKIEYLLYVVMVVVLLGPGVGAEFVKKLFHF